MQTELTSLMLPIALSAVAVFFVSALSWMVAGIHAGDWRKLPNEEPFLAGAKASNPPVGAYMFPGVANHKDAQAPDKAGPRGVVTFFPEVNMGRNLALTFAYFLAATFCLAYLATLALPPGAGFMKVFRFVATAGLMTHFAAIVPHAVWFRCRIGSALVDSIAFAATTAAIFAALWPKT
jgi:hypothetical protein